MRSATIYYAPALHKVKTKITKKSQILNSVSFSRGMYMMRILTGHLCGKAGRAQPGRQPRRQPGRQAGRQPGGKHCHRTPHADTPTQRSRTWRGSRMRNALSYKGKRSHLTPNASTPTQRGRVTRMRSALSYNNIAISSYVLTVTVV